MPPATPRGGTPSLPCIVCIVAGDNAKHFYDTLKDMLETGFRYPLRSGYKEKTTVLHVYRSKMTGSSSYEMDDFFEHIRNHARFFAVAQSADILPDDLLEIADAVVNVTGLDSSHIIEGIRNFFDSEISAADAEMLTTVKLATLSSVFRQGRSVEKSISICKQLAYKSAKSKKSEHVEGPRLEDLHGLGEAAEWGRELAIDLADWKVGKISWSDVDRGVLLYGPPGTGKTTFASALARTCGVPVILTSIAQWQAAGHLGDMLKAMRASFAEAKEKAPCILFIDEIDSIGDRAKFSGDYARYSTEVVNALLECLDGADGREGIVVVGATNFPNSIDAGLKRAGRLDRHVEIPLPDGTGREGILRWHLKGALESESLESVILRTEGASGADLEQLVRGARRIARRCRRELSLEDLLDQMPVEIPCPPDELWRVALHEAGHAVIVLEHGRGLIREIFISRTFSVNGIGVGGLVSVNETPCMLATVEVYRTRIRRLLGGLAAEDVVLGSRSDGGGGVKGSDLHAATMQAIAVEAALGLGSTLVHLSDLDEPSLRRAFNAFPTVREQVKATLEECYEETKTVIQRRRHDVEKLASAIMDRGQLTGLEIEELLSEETQNLVIGRVAHV